MYFPSNPTFMIAKLGYAGVYLLFLFFAPKHKLWVHVKTCTHNLCFEQKQEKYQNFSAEYFQFFQLKNAYIAWASFRDVIYRCFSLEEYVIKYISVSTSAVVKSWNNS